MNISKFHHEIRRWYHRHRRDLPWRIPLGSPHSARPDPYHVLLSEFMLQQTQVSTVIPYFERFLQRFPTLRHLAAAEPHDVLCLWQGLGYYSRARLLHGTARIIAETFHGRFPRSVDDLRALPGIGPYTAGAIASLAFDIPAPILDGNVARILCRLDRVTDDPRRPEVRQRLWRRAAELVPARSPGDFNSALMELGALICTPRSPNCSACPVAAFCEARAAVLQNVIPVRAAPKTRPIEKRSTFCIRRRGRWLIEQRPQTGRWANMWQFITTPSNGEAPTAAHLSDLTGLHTSNIRPIARIEHALTHRQYQFDVFLCDAVSGRIRGNGRTWCALSGLGEYPLPRPHARIATLLSDL